MELSLNLHGLEDLDHFCQQKCSVEFRTSKKPGNMLTSIGLRLNIYTSKIWKRSFQILETKIFAGLALKAFVQHASTAKLMTLVFMSFQSMVIFSIRGINGYIVV